MAPDVRILSSSGLSTGFRTFCNRRLALWWAASDFVGILGGVLLMASRALPTWVSQSVSNTLIIASVMLCWIGMRLSVGLSGSLRVFASITLAFFVMFQLLIVVYDDLGMRVLLSSLAIAFINVGTAFDLTRGGDQSDRRIRAVLSTLFVLHGLFFLFRSATAMTLDPEGEFLRTGGLQAATVVLATVKVVVWTVGGLMLLRGDRGRAPRALLG